MLFSKVQALLACVVDVSPLPNVLVNRSLEVCLFCRFMGVISELPNSSELLVKLEFGSVNVKLRTIKVKHSTVKVMFLPTTMNLRAVKVEYLPALILLRIVNIMLGTLKVDLLPTAINNSMVNVKLLLTTIEFRMVKMEFQPYFMEE